MLCNERRQRGIIMIEVIYDLTNTSKIDFTLYEFDVRDQFDCWVYNVRPAERVTEVDPVL